MITIQEFQSIVGDALFGGSFELAGIAIYAGVLAVVFACLARKQTFAAFALMVPITFIFTSMGVLTTGITVLLVFMSVLGMGLTSKNLAGRS